MKKKILLATVITFAFVLMFSFSSVFATNTNPVEGIRNFVGGAENVMEDAASGITNGVRNATGTMTNGMDNTFEKDNNMMTNDQNNVTGTTTNNNNNGNYTARRTATGFDEPTLLGINMTTWTWIIMAITAVAIITLIWSYTRQTNKNYNSYDK